MMDKVTLDAFEADWGEGTPTSVSDPANLTEEESKLYQQLKEKNIRLEQENISNNFVKEKLSNTYVKNR